MDNNHKFLTTDEALDALRISYGTLLKLLQSGEVRATKVGRQWRIPRTEVDRRLLFPTAEDLPFSVPPCEE
jgi:excisionase family DNA binding protein